MAVANSSNITSIQILRSYANTTPSTLLDGQLAFSFLSNTLYIGSNTGVIAISDQATANLARQLANTKVSKSGDTMTGDLKFGGGGGILGNFGTNEIAITSNVLNDLSGFVAYDLGSSVVYANTSVQLVANTGGAVTSIWNFNPNGSLTFPDSTIQTTAYTPGGEIDELARAIANAAYFHANGSFLKANASYAQANVTIGVDASQNTRLTVIEGTDVSQNVSIATQNSFITIIQGVDVGQNNRMSIIEGVDVSQNSRMTINDGVNASQNVRLDYSNTAITIIQGVDTSQNARMTIIESTDLTQNTAIAATDGKMQSAYNRANNSLTLTGSLNQSVSGNVTIGQDLIVAGNLVITGNINTQNVQQLAVADPLIVLGIGNYLSDTKDIGFAGHYNDGTNAHAGLIRDSSTKEFYVFQGYVPELDANNNVDITDATFRTANLNANYVKSNVIANTITVSSVIPSTSNTTGSLIVSGGMGITGNVFLSAANNYQTTTAGQSYRLGWTDNYFMRDDRAGGVYFTGAYFQLQNNLIVSSGVNLLMRGTIRNDSTNATVIFAGSSPVLVQNTASSTSTTTGALTVAGGVGIDGTLTSRIITSPNYIYSSRVNGPGLLVNSTGLYYGQIGHFTTNQPSAQTWALGYGANTGSFEVASLTWSNTGIVTITSNNTSTSNTTGALVVGGGVGISGNTYVSNTLAILTDTAGLINRPFNMQGGIAGSYGARFGVSGEALDYYTTGGYSHFFATNGPRGAIQFAITPTSSAVNYLQATGSATGTNVILSGVGSDANVGINFTAKGSGGHVFYGNSAIQFSVLTNTTGTTVNYPQVSGSASGSAVQYAAQGTDPNIGINILPKGTGNVNISAGNTNITGNLTATQLTITNTTPSISNTTGALIVNGGVGIAGNTYVGGNLATANNGYQITNFVNSASGPIIYFGTSSSIGAFMTLACTAGKNWISNNGNRDFYIANTSGGQPFYMYDANGAILLSSPVTSTNNTTGALVVSGGVGIGGNLSMNLASTGIANSRLTLSPQGYFTNFDTAGNIVYNGGSFLFNNPLTFVQNTFIARGPIINDQGNNTVLFGSSSPVKIQNGTASSNTTSGALVVQGGVGISGALNATTKSFNIPHPTKEGKNLRYGSLEGPEFGVYVRGTLKGSDTIELPDYWTKLVDANTITVSLTPIGKYQKLSVKEIKDNTIIINNDGWFRKEIHCYYTVFGERADVDKLDVES